MANMAPTLSRKRWTTAARRKPMPVLPNDMVTEVFSYLPAKSVYRFRLASHAWRAMLSSNPFVELHRRRANKTGQLKLFFGTTAKISEEESYFYSWQPGGAVKKLMPNSFHRPTPLTRPVHGLVLIRCTEDSHYICNPSTGAALPLPDTGLVLPEKKNFPCSNQLYRHLNVAYGFGYCSVTGEYKVVRIFSRHDHNEYGLNFCEVFVLDTPSSWRPTAKQPPACTVEEEDSGVFLNGCIHFLCHDGDIVAFDVSSETFSSVLPPPYPDDAPIRMTELDGYLCICHGCKDYADGTYFVWILRNYEEQKWEQLCHIDPRVWSEPERDYLESYLIAPLGMYNDGTGQKKVIFGTGTCIVFALDVPSCVTPEILFCPDEEIACEFKDYGDPVLGLFEESLVPVGRTIEDVEM